jgi:hypothetical protein
MSKMSVPTIYKPIININTSTMEDYKWEALSENPHDESIKILGNNLDKIHWSGLCKNTNSKVIKLLKKNSDKINWGALLTQNKNSDIIKALFKYIPKHIIRVYSYMNNILPIIEENLDVVDWTLLSENSGALHILENNLDKIVIGRLIFNKNPDAMKLIEKLLHKLDKDNWIGLSGNPNAISIIEKNLDKITHWYNLSQNPNAIHILEANIDKINWTGLSQNPNAYHILEANIDRICWGSIGRNSNPIILELVEKNIDKIPDSYGWWYYVSMNPNAIKILERNKDKVNWETLSTNPNALHLLENNIKNIVYHTLKHNNNPNAINIIINNMTIIENLINHNEPHYDYENEEYIYKYEDAMSMLYSNERLFELDYITMTKIRNNIIYDELITKSMHPDRYGKALEYHLANGGGLDDFEF